MGAVADWWSRSSRLLRVLWLVAIVQFAYFTADAYWAYDARAWDFHWVHQGVDRYLSGDDPYDVFMFVNPPAALLVLGPFGAVGFKAAHVAFLGLSGLAIAAAGALSLKAAGLRWTGAAGALTLLVLAWPSAVRSTLGLGNVNSIVVLCEAGALAAMLAGRWNLGGVALGLSFAVKPILVPLLIVPALARRWGSIVLAGAIPLGLSALAIALNTEAVGFFTEKLEFLWKGNADQLRQGNVSILGTFENVGLPSAAGELVRFAVLAAAAWLAWLRWRAGGGEGEPDADRRLRVLEATGFLMLATLLCFSFSWLYYGVYLLPLIVTIAHPGSLLRHPVAIAGLVLMLAPVGDTIQAFQPSDYEQVRPALSWLLILGGMGMALRFPGILRLGRRPSPSAAG
jgi:arabinofuranan 3-O-arabinosyltransferase